MTGWMIDEKDQASLMLAARATELAAQSTPDSPSHALGIVMLADGSEVNGFVVHSVDAVVTDGTHVLMIRRSNEPGRGKLALPGGFLDVGESAEQGAAREAKEEAGIDLAGAEARIIGTRNANRPQDVRRASNNGLFAAYGIAKGDVFLVSTQPVRFFLPNLRQVRLTAGDDAEEGSAICMAVAELGKEMLGIADHYTMITAALAG